MGSYKYPLEVISSMNLKWQLSNHKSPSEISCKGENRKSLAKQSEPSSSVIGGKTTHGRDLTFDQCLLNTSTLLDNFHVLHYLILATYLISEFQLFLLLAK